MKKTRNLIIVVFGLILSILVGGCRETKATTRGSDSSEEIATVIEYILNEYSDDTVDAFNHLHGSYGNRHDEMEVGIHEKDGHYGINIWTDGNELFDGNATIIITDIELVSGKYLVHGTIDGEEASYTLKKEGQVLYFEDIGLYMNMVE